MSRSRTTTLKCHKCKHKSEFVIWDSINTTLEPGLKEEVRSGRIFEFKCPKCGYKVSVEYPMLYHQMEDNVMIQFAPGGVKEAVEGIRKSEELMATSLNGIETPEYTKRVVATRNQLVEKLKILDAGLDDRILELMKPIYIGQFSAQDKKFKYREILFNENADGRRVFAVHLEKDRWAESELDMNLYAQIQERFGDVLDSLEESYLIDEEWARKTAMVLNEIGE